jgi:hypothetical protein
MGFIEETGAAQYYRDAKILTIYEGTTAIQANDLVGRKTARDGAAQAKALAANIETTEQALMATTNSSAHVFAQRLGAARVAFIEVAEFIAANASSNPNAAFAGSVPYLMLTGNVMAGWQMGRAMLAALDLKAQGDTTFGQSFVDAKLVTARFYADHILTKVPSLRDSVVSGADSVNAMALDAF